MDVEGITVFTDKPRYKIGDDVTVGITNNLILPLYFRESDEFWIQYHQTNGTWETIGVDGGNQAFWSLQPGESHRWPWDVEGLREYNFTTGYDKPFKVIPGTYRVLIFGAIESENPEPFTVQKEFIFE